MKHLLTIVIIALLSHHKCTAQVKYQDTSLFSFNISYRHSLASTTFQQNITEASINIGTFIMSARYNKLFQESLRENTSFSTFDWQFIGFTSPKNNPLQFSASFGIVTQPNKRVMPELLSSFTYVTQNGLLHYAVKGRTTTFSQNDGRKELQFDIYRVFSRNFKNNSNFSVGITGIISSYRIAGRYIPVETLGFAAKKSF